MVQGDPSLQGIPMTSENLFEGIRRVAEINCGPLEFEGLHDAKLYTRFHLILELEGRKP